MKRVKAFILVVLLLSATMLNSGCIGSFSLTQKVLDFNRDVGSKFVQEVVFLAFLIVPVYSVTIFIDGVILNLIEFWTGSNPISMSEGESESQIVEKNGNQYRITATKNQFLVEQLTGIQKGHSYTLTYEPGELAWYLSARGKSTKVLDYTGGKNGHFNMFMPDGRVLKFDRGCSKNAVKAAIFLETENIRDICIK